MIEIGGMYGFTDETGEFVSEPQFSSAGDFTSNGLAAVSFEYAQLYNGEYYDFCNSYIDASGTVIMPCFDYAAPFKSGGCLFPISGYKKRGIKSFHFAAGMGIFPLHR